MHVRDLEASRAAVTGPASAPSARRLGEGLLVFGALGLVVTFVLLAVLTGMARHGTGSAARGLALTAETLGTMSDSIDQADRGVGQVLDAVHSAQQSLSDVAGSADAVDNLLGTSATALGRDLPNALRQVDGALTGAADALEAIRRTAALVPGGRGAIPDPQSLRDLGDRLTQAADSLAAAAPAARSPQAATMVSAVTAALAGVATTLETARALLADYRAKAAEASDLAAATERQLHDDGARLRLAIALIGIVSCLLLLVPIALGWSLRTGMLERMIQEGAAAHGD